MIPEPMYPEVADEVDKASAREFGSREAAMQRRRPEGPPAVGACHYCGEALRSGLRWCDADCARDWEREQRG